MEPSRLESSEMLETIGVIPQPQLAIEANGTGLQTIAG